MNRFKARWAAWPVALLLVLSVSGVAGASALISFNGPAASALEHSAVAQALKAALGVEDEEGDAADDTNQTPEGDEGSDDADAAPEGDDADEEGANEEDAAPTEDELATCGDVEELKQQEGESHGDYVSRVAGDVSITGGPNDNHGFCVSAAARGLFDDDSEETAAACEAETEEPATDVEDEDVDDATTTCVDKKAQAKAEKAKAKAERAAEKAKEKADRKAEKAKQKAERLHGMGHGRGKGRGR